MRTKANDIFVNYQIEGKGHNLVLIHGGGDNLNMWYQQVPVFSKSYRVITYDIRGSGKTESPEGDYSMLLLSEDAYQLMKVIGVDETYLLGFGLGGRVALGLTLNHPEMVKALILANSLPVLVPPSPEDSERPRMDPESMNEDNWKKHAEENATRMLSHDFKSKNPTVFNKYVEVKLQSEPHGIARQMASLRMQPPHNLSKLRCPVLLLGGENDVFDQADERKQASEIIVGSKLVVLPAGHAAAIELPDEFNSAVLEFLSGVRTD